MATKTDTGSSLAGAIIEAQRAIGMLAKDSINQHHRYNYVSSESMLSHGRDALHKAGVMVSADRWEYVSGDPPVVRMTVTLVHPASREARETSVEWPCIESKGRPMDKAVAGALTTALSYYVRNLLLVPRGDENEVDRRDDSAHVPAPKPRQTAPAAPAPVPPGRRPTPAERCPLLIRGIERKAGCSVKVAAAVFDDLLATLGWTRDDMAEDGAYDDVVAACRNTTPETWAQRCRQAFEFKDPDGVEVPTFDDGTAEDYNE